MKAKFDNSAMQELMQEATRLTRAGRLQDAAATIQRALGGAMPPMPAMPSARGMPPAARGPRLDPDETVLDGCVFEVDEMRDGPADARTGDGLRHGRFIAGSHSERSARRDYKLYVPGVEAATPRPLVVMLHGCTQDPDDFAAGTRMNELAQRHGCYMLYPAQSQQANPSRCWNWFKHSHQQRGRGEPALIAGMTRAVMRQHRIDPKCVYVAGLSAGGAMAAILGQTHPELYAAVGVHSGLAAGVARDLPSALAAMKGGPKVDGRAPQTAPTLRPTIVFHGSGDRTVHPTNGEQVLAAALADHGTQTAADVQRGRTALGRRYTRTIHQDAGGRVVAEHWVVADAPHAWFGGSSAGSYTDPSSPDASAEMLRFFLEHPHP
jgi:poly(hydroxyalkanoate) depolymerase family esterase